jgi:SAM-dependent methyltransferase
MTAVRRKWSARALGKKSIVGWVLSELYFENRAMMAVWRANTSQNDRILDVGCGAGNLLRDLQYFGYRNLIGADPFIAGDLEYEGGLTIYKKELENMTGTYDLIMMHHSLEHMSVPGEILRSASRLLAPNGTIIVRLPLASSYAWRNYGVSWAQLDAPRHLFLHTHSSIRMLAKEAGLVVDRVDHEADDGTFWASEAYQRGVTMNDRRFPNKSLWNRVLSLPKNRRWRKLATEINLKGEADMVCFFLKKLPQQLVH